MILNKTDKPPGSLIPVDDELSALRARFEQLDASNRPASIKEIALEVAIRIYVSVNDEGIAPHCNFILENSAAFNEIGCPEILQHCTLQEARSPQLFLMALRSSISVYFNKWKTEIWPTKIDQEQGNIEDAMQKLNLHAKMWPDVDSTVVNNLISQDGSVIDQILNFGKHSLLESQGGNKEHLQNP